MNTDRRIPWVLMIVIALASPIVAAVIVTSIHYSMPGNDVWQLPVFFGGGVPGAIMLWRMRIPVARWLIPVYLLFTWGLMVMAGLFTAVAVFHDGP